MGEEFIVEPGYDGYVFLGWAKGQFEAENGEKRPYFNMYVLSPFSTYQSEDYEAFGYKAEKKKCLSEEVWKELNPGDKVRLFFTPEEVIEALGLSHCPWTEMSGQGCWDFEDLTTLPDKWENIFQFIHGSSLHITRLDAAYDDHTGILDIERIASDVHAQRYVSCMIWWKVTRSSQGVSCQVGNPKSKVLVRIYDKAAEGHC